MHWRLIAGYMLLGCCLFSMLSATRAPWHAWPHACCVPLIKAAAAEKTANCCVLLLLLLLLQCGVDSNMGGNYSMYPGCSPIVQFDVR
jgi:hypothetical protein